MRRTIPQNRKLHYLLSKLGVDEGTRSEMVYNYTFGRTDSSKDLTVDECKYLINRLEIALNKNQGHEQHSRQMSDLRQKARRTIFKLMYDCGFIDSSMNNQEKLFVINQWILNKTRFSEELNSLSYDELSFIIRQLQAVRRRYVDKYEKQVTYN